MEVDDEEAALERLLADVDDVTKNNSDDRFQPITLEGLLDHCHVESSSLIVLISPDTFFVKLDSEIGCATPAMIELAMLANRLLIIDVEEQNKIPQMLMHTMVVMREPGSHRPFRECENPDLTLHELTNAFNVTRLSSQFNSHVVVITQSHTGVIDAFTGCTDPFNLSRTLLMMYAMAKAGGKPLSALVGYFNGDAILTKWAKDASFMVDSQ